MNQVQRLFHLEGKIALVIGCGGLGNAIVKGLADAGAIVAIADISLERAIRLKDELVQNGFRAEGYQVDVTDRSNVETLKKDVISNLGNIDILINAFGITKRSVSEFFPNDVWNNIIDVNMNGVFYCSQIIGSHMLDNGSGSIINISSIAGSVGLKGTIAYAASKGGVNQITRTLGIEWSHRGVRVNAIAPSWFETDMGSMINNAASLYIGDKKPEEQALKNDTIGRVPIGRMGRPEEIVGAVIFLASDASSMVTGHILAVDGGFLAQ